MVSITCWWTGIPGIDGNCIPHDLTFADRAAAIVCAVRLHGALPGENNGPSQATERTANTLFDMFQETKTEQEGFCLRLAVAMICSTITPSEKPDIDVLKRRAKWLAGYMGRPPRNRQRRVSQSGAALGQRVRWGTAVLWALAGKGVR